MLNWIYKQSSTASFALESYTCDPFGNVTSGAPEFESFYGYNAEETNPVTGMQYLRARYYDSESGRFGTLDSYLGDITNPLSLNRYSYTDNNPVMRSDPSGHVAEWLSKAASAAKSTVSKAVSTAKNAAVSAVSAAKNTVSKAVSAAKSMVSKAVSTAKSAVSSAASAPAVNTVKNTATTAKNIAKTAVAAASSGSAKNAVSASVSSSIVKTVSSAGDKALQKVSSSAQKAGQGYSAAASAAGAAVQGYRSTQEYIRQRTEEVR